MAFAPVKQHSVCVVMPAYQAAKTLEQTLDRLPRDSYKHLIVVDDGSDDNLGTIVERLNSEGWDIDFYQHSKNRGYGANQKTCYSKALETDADTVVMVHPDAQYDPALLPHLVGFLEAGVVDVVLGSRILRRKDALGGGMPLLKYLVNRILTFLQNVILGYNLPEYHTGYRAYHRRVLEKLDFEAFSDDFIFDQQLLAAARVHDFRVGAVPIPTHYPDDATSIGFIDGAIYAAQTLQILIQYALHRLGLFTPAEFAPASQ